MSANEPRLPPLGWQAQILPELSRIAAADERIRSLRTYGSASGPVLDTDAWSDLDLLLVAEDPAAVAEDFCQQVENSLAPAFASHRSDTADKHVIRLVLFDLRRLDIAVVPPSSGYEPVPRPAPAEGAEDTMTELVNAFRFDAVLAAVRAARGDMLIGAHLTLQLARHILVIAMLIRDREAGTNHHRFGSTRWDAWAARLTSAPSPYTREGITAAIREYVDALDELLLLTHWAHDRGSTNQPLLNLLAAIDTHNADALGQ
ncbi:hypothetical protein ACWD4G_34775 [Streptomyces sp. NPDC002643]